jgi:hypothetical protein
LCVVGKSGTHTHTHTHTHAGASRVRGLMTLPCSLHLQNRTTSKWPS